MGDCRERLRELPAESVQCIVTSPPYWQLRDYGAVGQLGLEETPQAYVANLVGVMREVRRVLRHDGTAWVNIGDCYLGGRTGGVSASTITSGRNHRAAALVADRMSKRHRSAGALPPKSLVGVPWRFAFAMQDDGWILRSDIIWHKPNPMPESVRDRPTRAHEYLFLFSQSTRYVYDAAAIAEPLLYPAEATAEDASRAFSRRRSTAPSPSQGAAVLRAPAPTTKNARSVWSIANTPQREAHTAAYPRELARRCIAAGSRPGDVVLDPFAGTGTTMVVALEMGRGAVGVEISPVYAEIIERRLSGTQLPLTGPTPGQHRASITPLNARAAEPDSRDR